MIENNKKIVFEIIHPNYNNDIPYVESESNSIYFNEQLIFSDIYFQATDKETKNRSIKKEKNIYFNYEQENIIKCVSEISVANDKNTEIVTYSIKNNNSSPNNLYDINFYCNVSNLQDFANKHYQQHVYYNNLNIEFYINNVLLCKQNSIPQNSINVFKQISLDKNENIILPFYQHYDNEDKKIIQSIKIENI